ncbi:hypothetical protein FLJC2902T_31780 [Flavobacterium limnosediminis JC2902]|uniref:Uncharacterized protein n=1 Tax=Flavobacterium limnosediminis JC2902 TaxID=1341181 RepID=V6SEV9_9FLAO|nr:hypothetical protein [Flavobacterium limnosediminis]ESU25213.1 hypothetical protein FLJC2902T_31780 [Flavobacterium limnosediminis JC2902]
MRKLEIILFLLLLISNLCIAQRNEKVTFKIDTSRIAVLPFDENTKWKFKNCIASEISNEEILLAEKLLSKRVNKYNKEEKINPSLHTGTRYINLNKYYKQYIVAKNSKGEKEVYINCFCENPAINWKKVLNEVNDGGNCFFSLKINLTKQSSEELDINGP